MIQARVWQIPVLPVVFYTVTQRWDSVGRLLDLMERIMAFVYHVREPSEWSSLQETIEASVQTDEHRQEIFEILVEHSWRAPCPVLQIEKRLPSLFQYAGALHDGGCPDASM